MTDFTYKPAAQNKRSVYLFIAFAIGAVAFAILYFTIGQYRSAVGLVAMMFVVAAVFILTRYMAAEYYYDVIVTEDVPVLVVRHKLGKREIVMCRIELGNIISVVRQTKEDRKAHLTSKEYARFTYSPTVDPEITYLITTSSRTEKAEITIEADEDFAAKLMRYVEEIRASYPPDEDYE